MCVCICCCPSQISPRLPVLYSSGREAQPGLLIYLVVVPTILCFLVLPTFIFHKTKLYVHYNHHHQYTTLSFMDKSQIFLKSNLVQTIFWILRIFVDWIKIELHSSEWNLWIRCPIYSSTPFKIQGSHLDLKTLSSKPSLKKAGPERRSCLILVAFITGNSSLEPLIEGLYAQIHVNLRWRVFGRNRTGDLTDISSMCGLPYKTRAPFELDIWKKTQQFREPTSRKHPIRAQVPPYSLFLARYHLIQPTIRGLSASLCCFSIQRAAKVTDDMPVWSR